MAMNRFVVSYDVSDDRARRRFARVLAGHGYRALYSVFDVQVTPRQRDALLTSADELLSVGDRLLVLPTCPRCRHRSLGEPLEPEHDDVVVVS